MKMTMDDFTEPVDRIAQGVFADDWENFTPDLKRKARQQMLELMMPGLQPILDAVNTKLKDVWQAGRESIGQDMLQPTDQDGMKPSTPNPYA